MIKPKIEYSNKSNLLEQSAYRYKLQDVAEPNLYRQLFDYKSIPKVSFNHRLVPMEMPANIWVTDTTFRDGQQSGSPFTVQQIVDLYKMFSRLGGPKGVIRQSEFFLYTEKDQQAVRACQELGLEFPEITSWIRANKKDFELVRSMEVAETGILVSCSDYHIFKKMNLTRAKAMDQYLGIVKDALDAGIRPRCHFEDLTRADFYGFVVPFATELMKLSQESGVPIKIRACDTLGYGVPYPGAALPRSVPGIIYGLRHYAQVPFRVPRMARPQRLLSRRCQRRHRVALRLLRHQLRHARHRRAHRQLPDRGHAHAVCESPRHDRRHGFFRHHRDRGVFRKRHRHSDPAAHAVRRPQLQLHPRGHPRRRPFEGWRSTTSSTRARF